MEDLACVHHDGVWPVHLMTNGHDGLDSCQVVPVWGLHADPCSAPIPSCIGEKYDEGQPDQDG